MRRIKLEELAPYLPYDLMCELVDQGKTVTAKLCGVYSDGSCAFFDTVESEHGYDSIKPILRPLSELDNYCKMRMTIYESFTEYGKLTMETDSPFSENIHMLGYYDFIELFKYHYDVFGLIPDDLAIDINTASNEVNR